MDEIVRCPCGFKSVKSGLIKTKGICPKCKSITLAPEYSTFGVDPKQISNTERYEDAYRRLKV